MCLIVISCGYSKNFTLNLEVYRDTGTRHILHHTQHYTHIAFMGTNQIGILFSTIINHKKWLTTLIITTTDTNFACLNYFRIESCVQRFPTINLSRSACYFVTDTWNRNHFSFIRTHCNAPIGTHFPSTITI